MSNEKVACTPVLKRSATETEDVTPVLLRSRTLDQKDSNANEPIKLYRLLPLHDSLVGHTVDAQKVTIGRNECDIVVNDTLISGSHCTIEWKNNAAYLTDTSTNGTFINGQKVVGEVPLKSSDEITFKTNESFGYLYKSIANHSDAPTELEENLMCAICHDVLYDSVCLIPCLHTFCGACYSAWMDNRKTSCPTCVGEVTQVRKNHQLQNLVDTFLLKNPDKRRSQEERDQMDKTNKITKEELQIKPKTKRARIDHYDDDDEYSDSEESMTTDTEPDADFCRQCPGESRAGMAPFNYQCPAQHPHVRCNCCYRLFPDPVKVQQFLETNPYTPPDGALDRPIGRCDSCSVYYCNSYWNCTCMDYCIKRLGGFLPFHLSGSLLSRPLGSNMSENVIFQQYLLDKSMSLADVVTQSLEKLKNKEIDLKEVKPVSTTANKEITNDSYLCRACYSTYLKELIYLYRASIPSSDLPESVTRRPDCWWGRNCRTATHNANHAQKLNHICKQTKR